MGNYWLWGFWDAGEPLPLSTHVHTLPIPYSFIYFFTAFLLDYTYYCLINCKPFQSIENERALKYTEKSCSSINTHQGVQGEGKGGEGQLQL